MITHNEKAVSACATIGFFDGVHRGHQFVINRLHGMAKERGMRSMVITFDQHPRQVVHADYVPQLITPTEEKLRLLRLTEANDVEVYCTSTPTWLPCRHVSLCRMCCATDLA